LDEEVGTVETGKARRPSVSPSPIPPWPWLRSHPHDRVAWSAGRFAVRHVLVAGEMLVEDGHLTHLDLEQIERRRGRAAEAASAVPVGL